MSHTRAATDDTIDIRSLRARFRGALIRPGEESYEEARRVWNGAIDRRPAIIARCAGADDVAEAVRFARERDLRIAVRGGGHSVAGYSTCDDGIVIDLSPMKGVRVDPGARTVRASAGLTWGELDLATQRFGLATPGGTVSHTGITGLTLGGGLGHLMRKHGLSVDNVLAADVVTADGERVRADAESEPELYWGLRGGGGNFGIVTALEFGLHPVGPIVLGGPMFWSLGDAPAVLRFLRQFAAEAPDELGIAVVLRLAPPIPFVAPEHYFTPVLGLNLVWCGDMAEGEQAIAPLRRIGSPIVDAVRPVPYAFVQALIDGSAPPGDHYYWKSHRLPTMSDEVIDILVHRMRCLTSPLSLIAGWVMGGAATRVAAGATAVGERTPGFELNVIASWPPTDVERERHVQWVRDGWHALRPHARGVYPNFLSDEGFAGVQSAYGARLERLVALKERWDPTNVFRLNANIPPGVSAPALALREAAAAAVRT